DFFFYSRHYLQLRQAAETLTAGLEAVFFNAQNNFTLQYTLLLAPLTPTDTETEILRKIRVVSTYLDILIARRIWNMRAIDYSTMQYTMFLMMREIRGCSADKLAELLAIKLATEDDTFRKNDRFHLHGMNGRQIHRLLARMTDYVETQSGSITRYAEYATRSGRNGYEIEHIWADKADRHTDEFSHPQDFGEYRNRIGDLLLLPKSFNASYGALPYEEKLAHYFSQNLLARSLNENCYQHNPGFLRFIEKSGLGFKPHSHFKRRDLDERQNLYLALAEFIWNPRRLANEAAA
ncbi:MAG TPA: DUF1524 domain-containing protein, partial [Stellaceae bacterium]|nr:DUF1524 domain-containing protein [Stellaceae bacterium]